MVECPVCFEETTLVYALQACGHSTCRTCLLHWFEACETTGQSIPTCPKCRMDVTDRDVHQILGRPFQQARALQRDEAEEASDDDDELTRQFLAENARVCGGCGTYVMKLDGCDLMQCLCGFRFCFQCGQPGRTCGCSPAHHYFWDNIVDQSTGYEGHPIATPQDLADLPSFMEAHRGYVRREQEEEASLWPVIDSLARHKADPKTNDWIKMASRLYRFQYHRGNRPGTAPSWAKYIAASIKHLSQEEANAMFPGVRDDNITSTTAAELLDLV